MRAQLVAIDGSGVAACCCAQLLKKSGAHVLVDPEIRKGGPVLMLSEQTQKLLCDVFDGHALFQDALRVRRRIVLWGKQSKVAVLPHSGLVMSESQLLAGLWNMTAPQHMQDQAADPEWTIVSTARPAVSKSRHFGSRTATASTVTLKRDALQDACWMEALDAGWLFLLPNGDGQGSLISVGGNPATLLGVSNLIPDQIESIESSQGSFAAYPRINMPLCAAGWISCGTAALGFDPICGEGAGNAVREAILASAVISGADKGLMIEELLTLYTSRLISGFTRHLTLCAQFYRSACQSDWWEDQIRSLEEGLTWSQRQVKVVEQQKYRLTGFELQAIG